MKLNFKNYDVEVIENRIDRELKIELQISKTGKIFPVDLEFLNIVKREFLPCEYFNNIPDDKLELKFKYDEEEKLFIDYCTSLMNHEKLKILSEFSDVINLHNLGFVLSLNPNNLVVDYDGNPRFIFRGFQGIIEPKAGDIEDLIREYKALIVSTIYPKHSFQVLKDGGLEMVSNNPFVDELLAIDNLLSIADFLKKEYIVEKNKFDAKFEYSKRSKNKAFFLVAIVGVVLSVILGTFFVYAYFFALPFNSAMLNADKDFYNSNYSKVMNDLSEFSFDSLPPSSKYILAYSYVATSSLSEQQKKDILAKRVMINSNATELEFWVNYGRGNGKISLDLAKKINDNNLILLALDEYIGNVEKDMSLSGDEKDKTINDLQGQIDNLAKSMGVKVNSKDSGTANSSTTSEVIK